MAEFEKGKMIEKKRKEMHISREKLSYGICDVTTLTRFEKGKISISQERYEKIQKKLGQPVQQYMLSQDMGLFIDSQDYEEYEKILRLKRNEKLVELVDEMEKQIPNINTVEKEQFIGRIRLFGIVKEHQKYIIELEKLLKKSVREYEDGKIPLNRIYNYTELSIMHSIAIAYSKLGNKEKSIEIYEQLYQYFDNAIVIRADRIYNKIIISYSNQLGLTGQYEKGLEVLFKGLKWIQSITTQEMLYNYYFNIGWILNEIDKKDKSGNYNDIASKLIEEAIALANYFMESPRAITQMQEYYLQEFK